MTVSPESYFTTFTDDVSNKDLYESEWVPKIQAYRKKLVAAIPSEYRLSKDLVAATKANNFNAIQFMRDQALLTAREIELTEFTAAKLSSLIASGALTSVELFQAFAKRACIAHQLTNCAMDIFVPEGLARAQELDKIFAETGKVVGPFHGLPVSIKEHYGYKGKITHGAYVSLLDSVSEETADVTQTMMNLGAVFFIRTSQPQCLMHLDSNNNVTGLTMNPYNLGLSPGGSSSGEGALGAFRGSVFGIGSDIGGSIRTPAAFSGCNGLRPTSLRVSLTGAVGPSPGQESVKCVVGPLSAYIEDLQFFMDHYLNDGKPAVQDPTLVPLPWRKTSPVSGQKIKVGIMSDDGIVKPLPPIARGLQHARAALERLPNVEVVDFLPIKTQLAYDTVHQMYNADGNRGQKNLLKGSGEPLVALTKWALAYGKGDAALSVHENQDLNYIRDNLRAEYTKFMEDNGIDFLLTPTYNNVAPLHEKVYNWSYTSLFNLLDFPTLAFQTGLFQDPIQDVKGEHQCRGPLEELEWGLYEPEKFAGAPIALLLAGKRHHDEQVLQFGKHIQDAMMQ
ncbi:hypothetical protein BABINDRAFT_163094 [Babjeviella inositovora NRRL Y-12698]|uniref:Amidase domain-containing protein n=1 Tax=Babjeviella inositovora NRRL Y-12698 TaxID=984486 RepID=A0A1E3QM51_9ASCO|nr:uncharacterized protein BABINDRAFT_163094 [Babjeviella inositovora NRRL Y-12698]ODQ78067.1 hypothetical protein BABINDRAFT_163094 [Babjeviella inositovora NRRL Y-12698]